ncbi:MAG: hypothetical protein JWQ95_3767 [Sphaerisporangium sp.]|nr:hypothetical protein [Sphaerisporangium sp.]
MWPAVEKAAQLYPAAQRDGGSGNARDDSFAHGLGRILDSLEMGRDA